MIFLPKAENCFRRNPSFSPQRRKYFDISAEHFSVFAVFFSGKHVLLYFVAGLYRKK